MSEILFVIEKHSDELLVRSPKDDSPLMAQVGDRISTDACDIELRDNATGLHACIFGLRDPVKKAANKQYFSNVKLDKDGTYHIITRTNRHGQITYEGSFV